MTFASIMVAVDLGPQARDRVRLSGHLADAFQARLNGVAAETPAYAVPPVGPTPGSA
ncbi:universal stress protein, partial [Methylobacterium sp. NPDC097213]